MTWTLTKKMFYELRWGRITLRLMQNRDEKGSTPWYAQLDGIGPDPATTKPPSLQISPDIPDVSAQQIALRWALPLLEAYSEQPILAAKEISELIHHSAS